MTDLLIGHGEVGSALHEVLGERRELIVIDRAKGFDPPESFEPDWLHIAIPYTDSFMDTVIAYVSAFYPNKVVIHSTVPIGTTRLVHRKMLELDVYYSPVRGRHPRLARYIREFPKWYASAALGNMDRRFSEYFALAGVQTRKAPSFEFLEWAKLWETTSYGYNLVMWQEIERQVKDIPGDIQRNLSALKSWFHEKKKVYDGDLGYVPIYDLVPGPIGGHCILPNIEFLKERLTPELYAWLIASNASRTEQ